MEKYLISKPMRLFFFVTGSIIWLGIWLTGFGNVHWFLYIPAIFFSFAVVTGVCPGMILSNLVLGSKE